MNPFQPTFGKNPPTLIGRDTIIDDFIASLHEDVGDERRATLFTGQRGMGKTVVLNALARRAKELGWIVAEVTSSPTMLEDMLDQIFDQAESRSKTTLRGINLSLFGFGGGVTTATKIRKVGWRMQITRVLEELQKRSTGVLFTIDEALASSEELKQFAVAYQHFVREDRMVAVAMAGLPHQISDLLQDKVLTFLRRSNRVRLEMIDEGKVYEGMLTTVTSHDRTIAATSLKKAVEATQGYPYLIQLVGSKIWSTHPNNREISLDDVQAGIPLAYAQLKKNVIEPVLDVLSDTDISLLRAMSKDIGASKTSELAKRLKVSSGYLAAYRARLLDADVVFSPKRGYLDFNIPFLREYLLGDTLM